MLRRKMCDQICVFVGPGYEKHDIVGGQTDILSSSKVAAMAGMAPKEGPRNYNPSNQTSSQEGIVVVYTCIAISDTWCWELGLAWTEGQGGTQIRIGCCDRE